MRPPAAVLTRPRPSTGRAAGPRGGARGRSPASSPAATRRSAACRPRVAPAPSIRVTISSPSPSSLASRPQVASASEAATDSMPLARARSSPRPRSGPLAESLARTAWVTSPARTRPAAACMALAFSSARRPGVVLQKGGEALLDAGGLDDEGGLGRELADLLGDGNDVLVVGQDHDLGARDRLDHLEDLLGRRVHRLAAGDDVVDAERVEDAPDAVAGRHRDDRGHRGRLLGARPPHRRARRHAAPRTPPRPGRAGR